MQQFGSFKNTSFLYQIFVLLALVIGGFLFSQIIFISFTFIQQGFSSEKVLKIIETIQENGNTLRTLQFFQTTFTFLIPALIIAKFFGGGDEKEYLKIEIWVSKKTILLAMASMIVALPLINALGWLNTQVQLPESMSAVETMMKTTEDNTKKMMEYILYTDSPSTFTLNILIIAVLAAISEELFFRGVLQNMFQKIISNHHGIIWMAAIIFSAVHFQFYGFIPRLFLGAYLGYLLYYSKSIWVPIAAHFANNFIAVLPYYKANPSIISDLDNIGTGANWWLSIVSFFLWLVLFLAFKKSLNPSPSVQ